MTAGSKFRVDLLGPVAGSQYDQLVVRPNSTLVLGDATLQLNLGFEPQPGEVYKVIDVGSGCAVAGSFACGNSISATYGGRAYSFIVNYAGGDGNDVVLYLPVGTILLIR